jgi:hypothetical protein
VLVYGDAEEEVSTAELARKIGRDLELLSGTAAELAWHQAAVAAFIELATLAQGVADWERERDGHDELSPAQQRLIDGLRLLAAAIDRSWRSGFTQQVAPELPPIGAVSDSPLPPRIKVKRCEGYAFYGLYPETYLDAARGLPADSVVIGLRSIGTGLAALVAAASGANTVVTLRPTGHPFARSVDVGPRLSALVRSARDRHFVIVDEGPGLSGSSFGGVGDWLERLGVPRSRITFMPGHEGELGPQATPEHRLRWAAADRRVSSFAQIFTSPGAPAPLHSWFEDLTGSLREPPADLSGGAWAAGRPGIPTSPSREARKYLLRGSRGKFLLKFAGLDAAAAAKFARARALHEAGFCPEPLALRYGFILERYVEGVPAPHVPAALLRDYLAFRTRHFPAPRPGASLAQLLHMAEHNIRQAAPGTRFDFAARWPPERLAALQALVRPVHIDGRLHPWEWLRSGPRTLKTDAVDHSQAHDLVGCQDILWDVAGAAVELGEPGLAHAFAETPARRDLLQLTTLCYLAFQLGWWTLAATPEGWARREWYRERVATLLAAL